jgi:hypothetical protein
MLPAGQSNVIARTALVRDLGAFDEALVTLADWEMWIKLAWFGKPVACDQIHVAYRIHPRSMTTFDVDCTPDIERMLLRHGPTRMDPSTARTFADQWRAHAYRRNGRRVRAAKLYLVSGLRHRKAGMLLRAVGAVLGERAMRLGERKARIRPPADPAWLTRYRLPLHDDA